MTSTETTYNLDSLLEKLKNLLTISFPEVKYICEKSCEIFEKEPNILNVSAPITLIGDIHGQFQDLLEIFCQQGYPNEGSSFLFIGDYVDRGLNSVEVILTLLILKIKYPKQVYLTRGNHESKMTTQQYGFYDEILRKYGTGNVWLVLTDTFNYMPLGAIICEKIYCLHGGLSPFVQNIDNAKEINRLMEIPKEGAFCDLLWSDPEDKNGWGVNPRGAGCTWGYDITNKFLYTNNLKFIARAHQLVMKGYNWCHNKNVLSIFSAPNYCYRCGNDAAILEIEDEENFDFIIYQATPKEKFYEQAKRNDDYFYFKHEMRYFI